MTGRINALTVVLESDVREDDVQATIIALTQIKGVLRVEMNVADITSYLAQERAKTELRSRLYEAIKDWEMRPSRA